MIKRFISIIALMVFSVQIIAAPSRIKDVAKVVGLSDLQVIGYGLVIGLDGTGDRNLQTARIATQSLTNMLERFGLTVSPEQLRLRNVAAVMVTANVPPFIQQGTQIDATVSSIGDATSLEGGTLLITPLTAPNGNVYSQAQGPVTVGGFSVGSGMGDRVKKNHTLVGRVVRGATMLRGRRVNYVNNNSVSLAINDPDFSTALNISDRINAYFEEAVAEPVDQATIQVQFPEAGGDINPVSFVAVLETLEVDVDAPARVVINERTGTIVVGTNVRLSAAAISHGSITIEIQQRPLISQPAPFSPQGQTAVVPDAQIQVNEEGDEDEPAVKVLEQSATVGEVATALNALGVKPRDLIGIFQALKTAGSLQAELVIM
ncbi:MAG: flagellar basal body P-ring protein FlgI [Candidatus Marinimicrobia bacterium]|nr:flagellar basal body P-ring protein FlgI [Candidatus Neomarinimicrobiota bacterium]MCF7880534.1 flagellar basal body P-ring protein FlgI [Candidatus Neomarinimicrobiota bacterium]